MINFKRGMNMPAVLCENAEERLKDERYYELVKAAGFDHVRIPVLFFKENDENDQISPEYLKVVETIIGFALKNDLIPILDMHRHKQIKKDAYKYKNGFLGAWKQVAEYFQNADDRIIFEILNEPSQGLTAEIWNEFSKEAIEVVRRSNPDRWIVIGPDHCNAIENLYKLTLPEDNNIIVTVHNYTPMEFSHQGAAWLKNPRPKGVAWEGTDAEKQVLIDQFNYVVDWGRKNNKMMWLGEFGVYKAAEMKYRSAWNAFVVKTCEERNIPWTYWEFFKGFGAFDPVENKWIPEILSSLI